MFGNAATSAPNDALLTLIRKPSVDTTVNATSTSAQKTYTPTEPAVTYCMTGVVAPKRNSMHGSAK